MSQMNSTPPRRFSRALVLSIAFAAVIRLFFWGYSGRTWGDAFDSVLHAANVASHLGLTDELRANCEGMNTSEDSPPRCQAHPPQPQMENGTPDRRRLRGQH